jgi:hypothetical protein
MGATATTSFGDVRFAEVGYPFAAPQAPFYLGDFAQIIKKIKRSQPRQLQPTVPG